MPRLTRKIPEPTESLQDLLDPPRQIRQSELAEYFKAVEALDTAREEAETLGALIIQKLMLEVPVQRGSLVAEILPDGRLQVDWGRG